MARPFTVSDEEILQAAGKVLASRGPDAFSIAEVASKVGLSRAAIILRFKSTQALKVMLLSTMVDRFAAALDALPKSGGGESLLHLAAFLGKHVGSRAGSARFFANFTSNLHDRELVALETRRGAALHNAISTIMPQVAIEHESAVVAFRAHLTGSILAWLGVDDVDPRRYLVTRTSEWLSLAGIQFNRELVEELSTPESSPVGSKSRESARAAPRRVRRAQSA